jgi:hypothetical protein
MAPFLGLRQPLPPPVPAAQVGGPHNPPGQTACLQETSWSGTAQTPVLQAASGGPGDAEAAQQGSAGFSRGSAVTRSSPQAVLLLPHKTAWLC